MAAQDTTGKKRKGASEAAPKAKKPRKSDDVAPVEAKPTRKSARKQAADFMDIEEEAAPVAVAEPVKPKKGKKSKAAADVDAEMAEPVAEVVEVAEVQEKPKKQAKKGKTAAKANTEVTEPVASVVEVTEVQEKPKKGGKKGKTVVAEETVVAEAPKEKAKKSKKSKAAEAEPVEDAVAVVEETTAVAKPAKAKGGKKQKATEPEVEVTEVTAVEDDADDAAEDDQTAALLAGFSDSDSDDADEDVNFDEEAKVPKLSAKQRKAIKQAEAAPKSNQPGVLYVGRVPRGFFEPQMKQYFSQFGKVNRLRLSRNKKTGASKHFAFVEFQSEEVADIVARTMNNYLLFGHILKVHLIPAEQVHPDLFKGANERFKVDPRNKKAGLEMERGVERAQWEKRVENENKRRTSKAKQLKEVFDYEFEAPALKTVDSVPKHTSITTLEAAKPQELLTQAATEETTAAELPKAKKGKKGAKAQAAPPPAEVAEVTEVVEAVSPAPAKKGKKGAKAKPVEAAKVVVEEVAAPAPEKKTRKRKSDVTVETTTVTEEAVPEVTPRSKRTKKEKVVVEPIVEEVEEKKTAAKPKKAKKAKA
ncbi:hypothetical protein J4E81_004144 [Alternaria sp. BMP 2799]|nr:hypothetical protein J4E81_004144 [Alternaria sp. BMP 2799]